MILPSQRKTVLCLAAALVALGSARLTLAEDLREEFHQTYPVSATGRFALTNVNGDVRVVAWDRNEVKVDAIKTASTKELMDELKIEVEASASAVSVETKYPKNSNRSKHDGSRMEVEYTVTIPKSASIDTIGLVNGDLSIEGVEGAVEAKTVNGRISSPSLSGDVDLSTVNGRIEVALGKASKTIRLGTVNGPLRLAMPANSGAWVKATTVNGRISNEFSTPAVKGQFVGRSMEGQIGAGGANVHLSTVNGSISITKTSDV